MNREFKFRAWDGDEIYSPMIDSDGNIYRSYRDYEDGVYYSDQVMQYTGIHDCKGKEIWEGDIDKYGYIVTYVGDKRENLGMNCGWYTQRDNFESWSQIECGDINLEIVGNIYENPELLNNNINL